MPYPLDALLATLELIALAACVWLIILEVMRK